jgi:hypothetical protein
LTWINNYNGIATGPLAALRLRCVVGGPDYESMPTTLHCATT